eukprot:2332081-Prymnesium_polylepis.1
MLECEGLAVVECDDKGTRWLGKVHGGQVKQQDDQQVETRKGQSPSLWTTRQSRGTGRLSYGSENALAGCRRGPALGGP